jgi:beta-glucanase (GH16 family)
MPNVAGALPAFWALMDGVGVSKVPYAEYDIMELYGKGTTMNTHLWYNSANSYAANRYVDTEVATPAEFGGNLADGYHTYWMNWQPDSIQIGVDDYVMGTWTPASIGADGQPIGTKWAGSFDQPAWVILNFAVGGFGWMNPSSPQPGDLPANMSVDWVWYVPLSQLPAST